MNNIYIGKENVPRFSTITEHPQNYLQIASSITGIILVSFFASFHGADGTSISRLPNNSIIEYISSENTYLNPETYIPTERISTYNKDISQLELNYLNIGQRPTQEENRAALAGMYNLDADWFDPIDRDLLSKTEGLIYALNVQPEIFPVPNGHIQLEYDTEDGRYMELELFPDKKVRMMVMQDKSNPIHDEFRLDVNKINQVVEMFYDRKF